ncbi:MAG: hypothetical protein ACI8S6_000162 [Myxococcota bacterium]|jgi:hypothetical protein
MIQPALMNQLMQNWSTLPDSERTLLAQRMRSWGRRRAQDSTPPDTPTHGTKSS